MEQKFGLDEFDADYGTSPKILSGTMKGIFKRMVYYMAHREKEIFTKQHRVIHGQNDVERKIVEYANSGTYTRAMSRLNILAKIQNTYINLATVITELGCSDKNAREMLLAYADLGAVEYYERDKDDRDQRLYFRATELSVRLYETYLFELYSSDTRIKEFLLDLTQFWRANEMFEKQTGKGTTCPHSDYSFDDERLVNFTKVANITKQK